ncbi:Type 3 secretion system secretin [Sporomusa acidovorans DSM 3132]|uniref:Type 3 secretion system secretin n=2 Tax=Sporomusa TaxID=2375 RepID=A0ABZ3J5V1_SPOA4|nr:type II secretion system protein D precursor [Sporomusa acidovorans DSM 3132]SDF77086.1 general secretion pathway protein D [Sporomusa acidovorans]
MLHPVKCRIPFLLMLILLIVLTSSVLAAPTPDAPAPQTTESVLPTTLPEEDQSQNGIFAGPGQISVKSTYSSTPFFVIHPKYLKADQVKSLIGALVPDLKISADPVTNTLVFMSTPDVYDQVKDLLDQIDTPPCQVIFEAEVLEINRDDVKNLGIDWGASTALPGGIPNSDAIPFKIGLGIPNHPEYGINLQGTINHLIENKKGRLLASPRIATLDGVTARILIGDRLAVESSQPTTGSTPIISVNYVDVGIKLEVTPTVNQDGYITTHIQPEVSNKTDTTKSGNPNIRTRQAETTLRVKSGNTIVLGGLIQRQDTSDVFKFPILGDLPLVGNFFTTKNKEVIETELIILLTPKLIDKDLPGR